MHTEHECQPGDSTKEHYNVYRTIFTAPVTTLVPLLVIVYGLIHYWLCTPQWFVEVFCTSAGDHIVGSCDAESDICERRDTLCQYGTTDPTQRISVLAEPTAADSFLSLLPAGRLRIWSTIVCVSSASKHIPILSCNRDMLC